MLHDKQVPFGNLQKQCRNSQKLTIIAKTRNPVSQCLINKRLIKNAGCSSSRGRFSAICARSAYDSLVIFNTHVLYFSEGWYARSVVRTHVRQHQKRDRSPSISSDSDYVEPVDSPWLDGGIPAVVASLASKPARGFV